MASRGRVAGNKLEHEAWQGVGASGYGVCSTWGCGVACSVTRGFAGADVKMTHNPRLC